ncbi:hypothetical protein LTR37_018279 [Vermiconidia calcicola]|uniref:Uncharacterized protein n=1 Tax=Vermiconidia calcicola TaxID=1690605 RepID=A0ACC3MHM4_9PEZI|nr:hypothetical protein LTR37_018279 [Vermiconidia calcicola]
MVHFLVETIKRKQVKTGFIFWRMFTCSPLLPFCLGRHQSRELHLKPYEGKPSQRRSANPPKCSYTEATSGDIEGIDGDVKEVSETEEESPPPPPPKVGREGGKKATPKATQKAALKAAPKAALEPRRSERVAESFKPEPDYRLNT